jgi:hypothetical protein
MPRLHSAHEAQANLPFSFTSHVGPIWNNGEAHDKCTNWLEQNDLAHAYKFSGKWETLDDEFNQNSTATFVRHNETCKEKFLFCFNLKKNLLQSVFIFLFLLFFLFYDHCFFVFYIFCFLHCLLFVFC